MSNKQELNLPKRQEGKLNIYMHISENSGVGYYRQYLPALKLREHNLANVLISDFKWGEGDHVELTPEQLFPIMMWADIVIVGRRDIAQYYAQWGAIREMFKIPIVMDTDDNVRFVRPYNPGYQGYYPGSEAITWNKYAMGKVFDAVTVSTQNLYDFHKKENPKIFLLPNNLDVATWENFPLAEKEKDGRIAIAFIGSASHTEGVQIIKEPLLKIMKKYPQIIFLLTHVYQHLFLDFPEDIRKRIEPIPWIKLEEWPQKMRELSIDIGLAPLADNLFNRAKSNLRWMEYSLLRIPTIVSPVKPYLCVKNNVTGIIAKEKEEWYNAMEDLTSKKGLRYDIGNKAFEEIKQFYNIDKNIFLWEKTYKDIHDKFHEYFGGKKNFIQLTKKKYREVKGRIID